VTARSRQINGLGIADAADTANAVSKSARAIPGATKSQRYKAAA